MTATLSVRRRQLGGVDAHGNPVVSYAAAVPWVVRGLAPGALPDPAQPNRDAAQVAWTVFADVSPDAPGEHDRVLVDGVEYEVDGRPADWSRGPWPHPTAGLVVALRRWED